MKQQFPSLYQKVYFNVKFWEFAKELSIAGKDKYMLMGAQHAEVIALYFLENLSIDEALKRFIDFRSRMRVLNWPGYKSYQNIIRLKSLTHIENVSRHFEYRDYWYYFRLQKSRSGKLVRRKRKYKSFYQLRADNQKMIDDLPF